MDIFIYDGVPNEPKIIYPLMKKHRRIKLRFSSCKKKMVKGKRKYREKAILNKLSHFLFSKMQKNLAQFRIKYPIKQCDYIGLVLSDYGGWQKSYMSKEYFNHVIYKEFEGRQFQVMNGYHEHLTQYYGDYMQLPLKKTKSHIIFKKRIFCKRKGRFNSALFNYYLTFPQFKQYKY